MNTVASNSTNSELVELTNSIANLFTLDSTNSIDEELIETLPIVEGEEIPDNIRNIGAFGGSNSIEFGDSLEADGHPDIYQFDLNNPNDLRITLDDLNADADLFLYDSSGAQVGISNNSDLEAETLSGTFDADTYSVGIVSYDDMDTDYSLSIQTGTFVSTTENAIADPLLTTSEPGDTFNSALYFGAFDGDGMLTHTESVGADNSIDLYQFDLSQSNDFNFVLEGMSADVDLSLFDREGEIIAVSGNSATDIEILTGSLSAGTYYLGASSYDSIDTNYSLHAIGGDNALSLAEINEVVTPGLATEFTSV